MALNFGILQPIAQRAQPVEGGRAMGGENTGLSSLGSGFMEGLKQGQDIKNAQTENEIKQQLLQQETMKTGAMQQSVIDAQTLRDAAQEGTQQYIDALIQTGNQPGAIDFQNKLIDQQKQLDTLKESDAKAYTATVAIQSQFWGRIQQGSTDPKTGQIDPQKATQTYNLLYPNLPDSAKKGLGPQFDMNQMMAGLTTLQLAHAEQLEKAKSDAVAKGAGTTPLQQNTKFLNDLQNKANAGDPDAKQQLDIAKQLEPHQQKAISIASMLLTSNSEATKQYYKLAADLPTLNEIHIQTQVANGLLDKSQKEGIVYGPGAGKLTGQLTTTGQELTKVLNTIVPLTATALHIPATALRSTAMISLIKGMNPTTSQYPEAIRWVTHYMDYLQAVDQHGIWEAQKKLLEPASTEDPEGYKRWIDNNPDPLKTAKAPDFEEIYKIVPEARSLGIEKDAGAIQTRANGGSIQTPSLDNNAPKAYKLNGKPFDMNAAIKATGLSEQEIVKQAGLQ